MSRRRRQTYSGCSVEPHRGQLRLRFHVVLPDGSTTHVARATGLDDNEHNRATLRPLAKLVAAAIGAGKSLDEVDAIIGRSARTVEPSAPAAPMPPAPPGPTLREYYTVWIREQTPVIRKAQARDYRRHLRYVLPVLGDVPLVDLTPSHVRGLQAELLEQEITVKQGGETITKKRSVKHVKNILAGSFRALIQQAHIDELVTRDLFAGLKWPEWEPPDPDPFTPDERARILEWFRTKHFGFHPGCGLMENRWLLHPAYHVYVHWLFWTGMRPSEV